MSTGIWKELERLRRREKLFIDTLEKISTMPRQAMARRLAGSTLRFVEAMDELSMKKQSKGHLT